MLEAYGNIWENVNDYDAVVITTNGFVKKNGELVMGKGVALEAKNRYPELPKLLGEFVKEWGNIVAHREMEDGLVIYTLPVKPEYGVNGEPGWKAKADITLILQSVEQLMLSTFMNQDKKILMPRPGCGNGGLNWEDVKPIIEPLLDDRFTVMQRLAL